MGSLRSKFDAVRRELVTVTEAEYARLASRDRTGAAMSPTPTLAVDRLVREIQQQHTAQQPAADVQQNIVPLPALARKALEKEVVKPEGTGEEILLQGFNWDRSASCLPCCAPLPAVTWQRQ